MGAEQIDLAEPPVAVAETPEGMPPGPEGAQLFVVPTESAAPTEGGGPVATNETSTSSPSQSAASEDEADSEDTTPTHHTDDGSVVVPIRAEPSDAEGQGADEVIGPKALKGLLAQADKNAEQGKDDAQLEARLAKQAEKVKSEEISSGGHTIQGTDELIPGSKTTLYKLETTDAEGKTTATMIDKQLAERLLAYKASPEEASSEASPEPQPLDQAVPEAPELQAKVREKSEELSVDPSSIADIVNVDEVGRGHHVADSVNESENDRKGQFLSNHEVNLIAENQDLIREGDAHRNWTPETPPRTETGDDGGGNDEGDPGDTGETPGGNDEILRVVHEQGPEIIARERASEAYDSAIAQYAHAKNRVDRLLAGKDAKELFQTAGERLAIAHAEFIEANAAMVNATNQDVEWAERENKAEGEEALNQVKELMRQRLEAQAAGTYEGNLDEEIDRLADSVLDHEMYDRDFQKHKEGREADLDAFNLEEATGLQVKVDKAMLEERTRRHPRLAKVGEWIKTHPKTRIAVGLGLTAIGVVGAATFNAPLVGLATAGGAALRGYGSYNFARGIGEKLASRKMSKADIQTVEDYLDVSRRESGVRRNSKRVGAVVAAALVAAPLVGRMIDLYHHPESVTRPRSPGARTPSTPPSTASTPPPAAPPATPAAVNVTPTDGNMLPWNFSEQVLHTNISNPDVLGQLVHNTQGITFNGNGLGGGLGAIRSVTIPGQGTFIDDGHINGAIQAILGSGNAA